jgi:hypothetical protein
MKRSKQRKDDDMPDDRKRNIRVTILVISALIILIIVLMNRSGPHLASQANTPIPPTSTASPTPVPTLQIITQTPSPLALLPIPTEETNWAINFKYHFPSGYWAAGKHQYTLTMMCPLAQNPNDRNQKWTNSFRVSLKEPLVEEDFYLRPEGISGIVLFSNPITTINNLQSTVALVSFKGLTYVQAESYYTNCTGTVQTDNRDSFTLSAGVPFQP